MRHFESKASALAYVYSELIATLQDDLDRMEGSEREHYTNEDRAEMIARIADIEELDAIR